MPPPDCPHIDNCEMYKLLRLSGTLRAWQNRYCRADYKACERFRMASEGRVVPINLMPSGAYLRTADSGGK